MKPLAMLAATLSAAVAFGDVCWDDAVVIGHTNGEKCFYRAGEEMVFTLTLRGVRGELPANTYFYDWVRTANDGKVEKGRAPVEKPLVVKTKLDIPGFVKLEANVVDRSGRRVPKKHMWEKRVFFQGGAGVDVDKLQAWPEPKDFDAYWARERKVIDDLPLEVVERTPIPCQNEKLNLWRMKIKAPAGVLPATGYLVIPKRATAANRMKATGRLSGYYNFPERCPSWLTNHCDGIEMYVNRHGCEVDQPEEYYKPFYKPVPYPPVHFRDMAYRAMLMFRYLKTLPEWNGKDLIAAGSSGGGMQTFWMGMLEPQLSFIDSTSAALADVFGFKYGRETGHLGERVEGINYFDICNAAKRVKCPVVMNAGIGDYTCPPMGLAIVYNNLRCQKQITWSQGCTHGWWPQGMKRETFSSGPVVEAKAGVEELTVGGRGKDSADPLGELMKTRTLPSNEELARLVAEDLKKPVRPGGVNGQPFWNVSSMQFMYPPAFDFKPVPGAVKYRFTVIDDWLNAQTMEAAQPTAALVEVWPKLRTGLASVICDGVDASGRLCGRAGGPRRFWKAVPFRPGAYKPAARSYAETAARACEHIWKLRNTQDLLTKGEPDPTYDLNCYPAKMNAGMIRMMLRYARLRPDRAADAIKVARAAADWLIGVSQPAGAPLEYFPPTYRGDKNTAKQYAGQQMLIYPAQAACAYLDLYAAVNDRKYFEAAERIGRTFLKLQGADGAWSLKLWEKDGKPVVPNRCFPLHQVGLLERLYAITKDPVWRAAGDRAFAYVEKGPLTTWNWEAQFEDVQPHPPYRALTKHDACSTAIYLVKRFPGDAKRLAQARELLRFSEDQFIYWEKPCRADGTGYRDHTTAPKNLLGWTSDYLRWFTPGVGEQYGWEMPIDASAAKLIRTYLALYEASGNPLDLAKARALGDAMTNIQKEDGSIRTQWLMRPDADNFWINCLGASIEALEMLR